MSASVLVAYATKYGSTQEMAEQIVLLPPESFFVQSKEGPLAYGELERAAQWARTLRDEYERQAKLLAVVA